MDNESALKENTQHVIAYVQRKKITHWKRLMDPGTGSSFPFLYGSRDDNVFAQYVKAGTVLWVVSSTPEGQPPSLVARLPIIGRADQQKGNRFRVPDDPDGGEYVVPKKVLDAFRKSYDDKPPFKYIAVGDPKRSRFYGFNNAGRTLLSLQLKWVHDPPRTLSKEPPYPDGPCAWQPDYGKALQRPARVVGDPKPLEDLHRAAAHAVFISWKHDDNWKRRKQIRQLAYALADEGLFVWLDGFAFPPSISLKEQVLADASLLQRLLKYGYSHCKALLALETVHYGEPGMAGNWTEMEWTGKLDDKPAAPLPLRAVYRFESSDTSSTLVSDFDLHLDGIGRQEAARRIKAELEKRFPLA